MMTMPDERERIQADLLNRFAYHPPKADFIVEAHTHIREVMLAAAMKVERFCPPGRERSLAWTKLEDAMFYANAAIARTQSINLSPEETEEFMRREGPNPA